MDDATISLWWKRVRVARRSRAPLEPALPADELKELLERLAAAEGRCRTYVHDNQKLHNKLIVVHKTLEFWETWRKKNNLPKAAPEPEYQDDTVGALHNSHDEAYPT